jgi:hypothetical protein
MQKGGKNKEGLQTEKDHGYSPEGALTQDPQSHCRRRGDKDTVELSVLRLGAHAAQLLLVTAQAPGVVADLLRTQTTVAI